MDAGSGLSPAVTLGVAFLGMLGLVLGPALVALINRGGKAEALDLPPEKVMPRSEYDALLGRVEDLDEKLYDAYRREELARKERDAYFRRAVTAETLLAQHGITESHEP